MEHFEEFEPDVDKIEDNKIIQTVLLDPKKAFKFIHKYRYENYVKPLLVLGGVSSAFDRAVSNNSGDHSSLGGIIVTSVLIGGLLGWISFYIYAAIISWTGGWLDGKANRDDILRIIAYAYIPAILTLLLMIVQIAVLGNGYFQSSIDLNSFSLIDNIIFYGCAFIQTGLAIWSLVLLVIGVAEAQKFSFGKALFNLLIPVLIIAVPLFLIILMVKS